jgi:hypothetical protein
MTRRRWLLGIGALALGTVSPVVAADRYPEIRRLIKKNLHFSGHMTWSVNTHTIDAVRPHVTEQDIPVLVRMLGDSENVVGIGAQYLLASFGDRAVESLTVAAQSSDWRVKEKAREALAKIEEDKRR